MSVSPDALVEIAEEVIDGAPQDDGARPEIGNRRLRKEDHRLITGRTRWTDNIILPGMLHLAMVRSPHAHAKIVSIDTDAAKAATNVLGVFTAADFPEGMGACANAWPITPEQVTPDHLPMIGDRVACAGEIVAAVVARSAAAARDAAELVDVEYDELPAVFDALEAMKDEVLAHPDKGTNKSAFWQLDSASAGSGGDVEEAIAKAREDGIVIEREYRQQRLIPAFMEPRSTVVDPTGEQITMWSATQVPHILRFLIAATTGIPESKVRVIAPDVGGGFGGKLQTTPEEFITLAVARRLGKPVKYTESRSESLVSAPPRPRPVSEAHAQRDQGRDRHRAQGRPDRQPRSVCRGRRRRCARPGRLDVQRDLQIPGVSVQLPDRADQHHLGRRLPRRRPSRGDLRDRADDGRARRRGGRGSAGDPREELDQARGVPVHVSCGDDLRLRQLRGSHRTRQGPLRL
ncbi:hypothetical protein GCM10009810_37190 [Nostocoides vanveenii]|uniref:Aldehyde oxidase/xanthine dehydrogenase a/b hammerhead domain-containing protein n=1 Tax=Nostocoides vanveenii TaxID=330835 RepID=A0ABN2L647_9MICO